MITLWNRRFAYDILISFFIIIIPFLLSLHLLFDDTHGKSIIYFFGMEFKHPMAHNRIFMWAILVKLIPILLLSIWFLSSQFWWKYFILFPFLPFASSFANPFYIGTNWFYYYLLSLIIWTAVLLLFNNLINNNEANTNETSKWYFPIFGNKNFKSIINRVITHRETKRINKDDIFGDYFIKNLFLIKSLIDQNYIISSKFKVLNKKALIITLMILSFVPIIYFFYLFIPATNQYLELYFFKIGNFGFSNVRSFLYYFNLKLSALVPLCVWFITCHYWWRYAILCPIILYTYQIWEAVQTGVVWVDETEYVKAAPFIIILILLLLFISEKVKYQSKIIDSYKEINSDIQDILDHSVQHNNNIINKWSRFTILKKKDVLKYEAENHLLELLEIKEELLRDLKDSKTM